VIRGRTQPDHGPTFPMGSTMKTILAIGGAVVKTSLNELRKVVELGHVEMLIHNGGSLFHDFQLAVDHNLTTHSYPLSHLLDDFSCNKEASLLIEQWLHNQGHAPANSVTGLCRSLNIPVLLFTALGCDFWQIYLRNWNTIAEKCRKDFDDLTIRMKSGHFHYICMGSAVIHPEVFIKCIALAKPKNFKADVVDFLDMYRPRTRVGIFGDYYQMTHQEFLSGWIKNGVPGPAQR
jgi:hypothetical protein